MGMVSPWVYTDVKMHQTVCFKYVQLIVGQLYFMKAVREMGIHARSGSWWFKERLSVSASTKNMCL